METIRIEDRITQLFEAKDITAIRQILSEMMPVDIAEMLEQMDAEYCVVLMRLMDKELAAEVFSYLGAEERGEIARTIGQKKLGEILDDLNFDDKIDFLEEMPANFVKGVLAASTPEERKLINQFLSYEEDSAGSLMTIEFIDLKKDMTAAEALDRIRKVGLDSETVYTCYVLDKTRRLEGIVSLKDLVMASPDAKVGDFMDTQIISAEVPDDQQEVAELCKRYDLMTIPVVDGEHRLVGIITIDDIVDVIERENTEDFQRMAAIAPSEDEYLQTGVFTLAKRRIVWLLILMVSATISSAIILHYEDLLSSAVILSAFMTMLTDSGGNAGSQSSTLIIRGMALGEIELKDWLKVLWKELRVGVVAGVTLAVVNLGRMMLFKSADFNVCLTVSITLLLTVIMAKLVGGLLPLGAKVLRLDPAIMAGPLITTIVDAVALVIYFGIASVLVL